MLTVAHLDHTPENCDPENLRAMCPASPDLPDLDRDTDKTGEPFSTLAAMTELDHSFRCQRGVHSWVPWLAITNDSGAILRYETFCTYCRRSEQFDV